MKQTNYRPIALFAIILSIAVLAITILSLYSRQDASIKECNSFSKQVLKDTCFAKLGMLRNDINICDMADNSKFYCYEGVAENTQAPAICDEIKDTYWQSICYQNVGILKNEAALCSKVITENLKDECYFDIAVNTTNENVCSGIESEVLVQACYNRIAKTKLDADVCFNLDKGLPRDRCIFYVAKSTGNVSMCSLASTGAVRNFCVDNLGGLNVTNKTIENSTFQ